MLSLPRRLFPLLINSLLLFIWAATSYAQTPTPQPSSSPAPNWNAPYSTAGQLGTYLETVYGRTLDSCNVGKLFADVIDAKGKVKQRGVPLSSVPRVLQINLPMTQAVAKTKNETLARLFAYIYSSDSRSQNLGTLPQDSFLLFKKDLVSSPTLALSLGRTHIIYSHNCSAIVSAAANASTTFSFPVSSIKGALDAEYGLKRRTNTAMVQGVFSSPFTGLLRGDSTGPESVASLMTLWDWYTNNLSEASKKHWMLNQFGGVAVVDYVEQTKNIDVGSSVSGAVGLPFVSVDAKVGAQISDEVTLGIQRYETTPFGSDDQPQAEFVEIPSPGDIVTRLSGVTARLQPGYHSVLDEQTSASSTFSVEGIPTEYCKGNYWDIVPGSAFTGDVIINSMTHIPADAKANNPQRCNIEILYTPKPTVFKGSGQVTLDFKLQVRRPVGANTLTLKADAVKYATNHATEVTERKTSKRPTSIQDVGSQGKQLIWTEEFTINDEGVIDWNSTPTIPSIKLNCGQDRSAILLVPESASLTRLTTSGRRSNGRMVINFSYTADPSENLDVTTNDYPVDVCTLDGSVTFGRLNPPPGTPDTVDRALPGLQLLFPRKRVVVPASTIQTNPTTPANPAQNPSNPLPPR